MSFWSKLFGITAKVGEEVAETATLVAQITQLENQVKSIQTAGGIATTMVIADMLNTIGQIKYSINQLRK